jgi:hypothetical protein
MRKPSRKKIPDKLVCGFYGEPALGNSEEADCHAFAVGKERAVVVAHPLRFCRQYGIIIMADGTIKFYQFSFF